METTMLVLTALAPIGCVLLAGMWAKMLCEMGEGVYRMLTGK